MSAMLADAIRGGAAGLSTSYVDIDEDMRPVPNRFATKAEIITLGLAMKQAGRGLVQTVPVFYNPPEQMQNILDMGDISRATALLCSIAPIVHDKVLVNGAVAWEDGEYTGARAGEIV